MYRGTLVACVILKGFAYLHTFIYYAMPSFGLLFSTAKLRSCTSERRHRLHLLSQRCFARRGYYSASQVSDRGKVDTWSKHIIAFKYVYIDKIHIIHFIYIPIDYCCSNSYIYIYTLVMHWYFQIFFVRERKSIFLLPLVKMIHLKSLVDLLTGMPGK